jgi:hypothetical protein
MPDPFKAITSLHAAEPFRVSETMPFLGPIRALLVRWNNTCDHVCGIW